MHTISSQNPEGCLRGPVDDYLQQFDPQIEQLKGKIEADRFFWTKAEAADKIKEAKLKEVSEMYDKFSSDLSKIISIRIQNYTLTDLPWFG